MRKTEEAANSLKEELKAKSLSDLLDNIDGAVSVVFRDVATTESTSKSMERYRKMLDYLANFVTIFDFQLIGIDHNTMQRLNAAFDKNKEQEQQEVEGEQLNKCNCNTVENELKHCKCVNSSCEKIHEGCEG